MARSFGVSDEVIGLTLISVTAQAGDKNSSVKQVIVAGKRGTVSVRCAFLRTLGALGGIEALEVVRVSMRDNNQVIHDTAVETLIAWPDAEAIADLRELTERATDRRQKILALRGLIRVTGLKSARPGQETVALYKQAWNLAERSQEKKLILSGVGNVQHLDALRWVETHLADPAIATGLDVNRQGREAVL